MTRTPDLLWSFGTQRLPITIIQQQQIHSVNKWLPRSLWFISIPTRVWLVDVWLQQLCMVVCRC